MIIARHQVLATLSRHVGERNGVGIAGLVYEITGEQIRNEAHERRVRAVVSDLREEGFAVCAHPSTGYFMAATALELDAACQFLRSRAMHSLVLESRLRKIPLPELLGQLRLNT